MSLRAGIVTDLQKIADELLSDPLLHQRLEGSDQNGYKTLGDALDDAGE
jgi:hypothetical protein